MMVMVLNGQFIQGTQGRVLQLPDRSLADQQFQVAVHRGQIQGRNMNLPGLKNLFDSERAVLGKGGFNGGALSGVPCHIF